MEFEQPTEDQRFEQIQRMEGLNIQSFYQEEPEDLFPLAQSHPQFFNQNLVNPSRVLKQFLNDAQSNIRIFYFQLLRLAFEVPTKEAHNHLCMQNLKKIVFHPEFEILFTPDTENEREVFNDFQFKKLFAEFVSLLIVASENEPPNVQQALNQFPIIDIVLIHIIRSLLVSFNIKAAFDEKIPTDLLFKQLSSVLQLSLTSYGNCWKFEESDMFCYQDNEEELYLAFMLDDYVEDGDEQAKEPEEADQGYNNQGIVSAGLTNNFDGQRVDFHDHHAHRAQQQTWDPVPGFPAVPQSAASNTHFLDASAPTYASHKQVTPHQFGYNVSIHAPPIGNTFSPSAEDRNIESMFQKMETALISINSDSRTFVPDSGTQIHQSRTRDGEHQKYQPPANYSTRNTTGEHPDIQLPSHNHLTTTKKYTPTPAYTSPVHTYASPAQTYAPPAQNFAQPSKSRALPVSTYSSPTQIYTSEVQNYSMAIQYSSRVVEKTDYSQDFTPVEILNKLRPNNRDNISRIKEQFNQARRGDLPSGYALGGSAVRTSYNVETLVYAEKESYSSTYESKYSRPYSTKVDIGYQGHYGEGSRNVYGGSDLPSFYT